jgi:hypothetical protein
MVDWMIEGLTVLAALHWVMLCWILQKWDYLSLVPRWLRQEGGGRFACIMRCTMARHVSHVQHVTYATMLAVAAAASG